ncbi:hypothetical protein [Bacillus solimangrovi]|uniref:hypothetical protein n=1 Tax=Bacillus solimangrovi TaxID=1305675 RepID=UPI001112F379|nr:hypothetical protein [Bacillus solimangrovi]
MRRYKKGKGMVKSVIYLLLSLVALFFGGILMFLLNNTVDRYKPKKKVMPITNQYRSAPVHNRVH